jgi:dTDP-4-amino-4,6-dideoxygalactose transaminase
MTPSTDDEWIPLSRPDLGRDEMAAVLAALQSPGSSAGPQSRRFEAAFAEYVGRAHGVCFGSGTLALLGCLRAMGIGPGSEVIASPYSWHQIAHAISLAGATPAFADMDYWSGTLAPESAAARVTARTRAILAGNTNGHPAHWQELRELAERHGLALIEDSTEAIGSVYRGRAVGGFGDCAIFDFSRPSALYCGEGAMVLTDDARLASELRYLRQRVPRDRLSVSVGSRVPMQAPMSELGAALGVEQVRRIDEILERRKRVEALYARHMQSFEGIKPPYRGPDVTEVHWLVYLVHLGTRFTGSARNQIVEDLGTANIEALPFCQPLHRQFAYAPNADPGGRLPAVEKIADRALALPFHGALSEDEVMFVVQTAKDSSVNVGAGAAIY